MVKVVIENADATPPHLDVILRLGSSVGMHGSLQFFALGCSACFSEGICVLMLPLVILRRLLSLC